MRCSFCREPAEVYIPCGTVVWIACLVCIFAKKLKAQAWEVLPGSDAA